MLATAGYDKFIRIWKETKVNHFEQVYCVEAQASVNSVQFCSWEYGLILAAGCADGKVHIIERDPNDNWSHFAFEAHDAGVNGLSWGPATFPCLLLAENNDVMNPAINDKALALVPKRFVTGGLDGKVKIWQAREDNSREFALVEELQAGGEEDWVRDVSWCNNIGISYELIACCDEGKKLRIYKQEAN